MDILNDSLEFQDDLLRLSDVSFNSNDIHYVSLVYARVGDNTALLYSIPLIHRLSVI